MFHRKGAAARICQRNLRIPWITARAIPLGAFVSLPFSSQGVSMNWLAKLFIILGSIISLLIAMNVGKWA
jgi:hypothetical protein